MDTIAFRSYSWVIGSTSFRTKDFNLNIEKQLELLSRFRNIEDNASKEWTGNESFQEQYYSFLKENGFVKGDAPRPAKDARQKTSGLVDIGLLTDDRQITPAGKALLDISLSGDFAPNNILGVNKDSYLYLKQLLKASVTIDNSVIRPFVVFLYVIDQLGTLSYDEFTYLLPLCVSAETMDTIIKEIQLIRDGKRNQDNVIINTLLRMPNYKSALMLFLSKDPTEELICEIGMNRKSRTYDKPYYGVYKELSDIVFNNKGDVYSLFAAIDKVRIGHYWKQYLFSTTSRDKIKREGKNTFNDVQILKARSLDEFKTEFFKLMHLFKAKATLQDYFDLNRRYFKATDIVIFEDQKVRLDIVPQAYFKEIASGLKEEAFKDNPDKENNISLRDISEEFVVTEKKLYKTLSEEYGVKIKTAEEAEKFVKDDRYRRFNKLINERFPVPVLIDLFDKFKNREDDEIRAMVTDNADVPTIFEYILAIAWYEISERKGDVLEYMNLSLEADLLPKTHASGGDADIVWKYDKTDIYPKHTLLIEATLSDGTNQRRMEMEPVSRHLGDYRLANPSEEAYCVFVATFLHPNVISDFRQRKNMDYYDFSGTEYVHGLKILALATDEIKTLLRFNIKYDKVYELLDAAYESDDKPAVKWYEKNIVREVDFFDTYKA